MNSGALRQLVTLDTPTNTEGAVPLDPPTWWCAALTEPSGTATLIGRYHPGITTATRVHLKGRTFHVDTVANRDERDVELVLTCREVFE